LLGRTRTRWVDRRANYHCCGIDRPWKPACLNGWPFRRTSPRLSPNARLDAPPGVLALAAAAAIPWQPPATASAEEPTPQKQLILPGEVFTVGGHTAFLFTPAADATPAAAKPWLLYAPTLPAYPDKAEQWMHEQFTKAGVDTGESYGSPRGVAAAEALHVEMVRRGCARKLALLGRSRGGLWASAWAIAHPELTAGVGGIYPVYDWRSYPGVAKAAPAYGLTADKLVAKAAELCPIERIDVAAAAGVPFCIIHGD
jgi:hypothetical protein